MFISIEMPSSSSFVLHFRITKSYLLCLSVQAMEVEEKNVRGKMLFRVMKILSEK